MLCRRVAYGNAGRSAVLAIKWCLREIMRPLLACNYPPITSQKLSHNFFRARFKASIDKFRFMPRLCWPCPSRATSKVIKKKVEFRRWFFHNHKKNHPGAGKIYGKGLWNFQTGRYSLPGRAFLLLGIIRDHHHFPSFCTIPCDTKKGTPQTGVNTLYVWNGCTWWSK